MELRRAEAELEEVRSAYEGLRSARIGGGTGGAGVGAGAGADAAQPLSLPPLAAGGPDSAAGGGEGATLSAAEALAALEGLRDRLGTLLPLSARLQRRLTERDPITDRPRYGDKTAGRVRLWLELFRSLLRGVGEAFGEDLQEEEEEERGTAAAAAPPVTSDAVAVAEALRAAAARDEELERQARAEAEAEARARDLAEAARLEREEATGAREVEERAAARALEEAALRREATEARRRREEAEAREERERREADAALVAAVEPGTGGVRAELGRLRVACLTEPGGGGTAALGAALGALRTLFGQIVARPEEAKFRRIRRNHEGFVRDIGRHPGGREVLIAAGFRPHSIDGVPCLVSSEPDLERDMDGWSAWFDLLKVTKAIVEEEMAKME